MTDVSLVIHCSQGERPYHGVLTSTEALVKPCLVRVASFSEDEVVLSTLDASAN